MMLSPGIHKCIYFQLMAFNAFVLLIGVCKGSYSDMAMQIAFRTDFLALEGTSPSLVGKDSYNGMNEKVKFYLYTRKTSGSPESLPLGDLEALRTSHYNATKPSKFVIHGFFGKVNTPMIQNIKDRFLELEDVNVVAVDWSEIAGEIDYFAVARQTGKVGLHLGEMLDFLVASGSRLQDFHLVGHSLGAHVAGFAGAGLRSGKLTRITGLDPAKPHFDGKDPSERLDSSDAGYVDCVHTCGGILGIYDPICHADFYPNGGRNAQPGCPLVDFGTCSHVRSHEYFAESIIREHKFPAMSCPKGAEDLVQCEETDYYMGYHLNHSARGSFYVLTNDKFPFAPIY